MEDNKCLKEATNSIYELKGNKIIITNKTDFNIKHILECGQIFRYEKLGSGEYVVLVGNKFAKIAEYEQGYIIEAKDAPFFVNFFDLGTDYGKIKRQLINYSNTFLNKAINFGSGIRILKNLPFEMIISFIISANNNIPRIKKSIKLICQNYGKRIGENYYAFPTLSQLLKADENFFRSIGLGYRAPYLVETIKMLKSVNFNALKQLDTAKLREQLIKLKGVGRKVADCIMLFGFNRMDVFPIDTWTNKVYLDYFYSGDKTRPQIANYFTSFFGILSGYAQQYLYYWKQQEEGKNKNKN